MATCRWPDGCDAEIPARALLCAAHVDELRIAILVNRDRRCPDCGEPAPLGAVLHECTYS
jgi:hypothetical protein